MKKILPILLGIVLLAASAYAASAFYFGKQVEAALEVPYQQLAANPSVKLIKRDYQRGIFSSTETVSVELFGDLFRMMGQPPLVITAQSRIQHGPFPGMTTMAGAVIDTKVFLQAGGVSDSKPAMTMHAVIQQDGSGEAVAKGQAYAISMPDMGTGSAHRISWESFQFRAHFDRDLREYASTSEIPRLEMTSEDGMRFIMTGVQVADSGKRVFDDEPALHAITQKVKVAEVSMKSQFGGPAVVMRNVEYDMSTPVSGEFMTGTMKMTIPEFLVGQQNYGPARFDMSMKNMHARSVAHMQKEMAAAQMKVAQANMANPMETFTPLLGAAMGVLKHNPELTIDRLSFTTPHGEVVVTAKVGMPGVVAEDASNAMALMQKLDAGAEVSVPEAILAMIGPATPEATQAKQRQLAGLIEQGYVHRDGALLKSKFEYRAGQFTVNGLPFNAMAMQQPAMPPAGMPPGPQGPRMITPMPVAR